MNVKLASALVMAAAITLAGCAASPSSNTPPTTAPPVETAPTGEAEAVWLDGGRMFVIVTWGSSSCLPFVTDVSGAGQQVSVTMTDTLDGAEQRVCTADYTARGTVVGTPEGVDPHLDATVQVAYDDQRLSIELDGDDELTGVQGSITDYLPSAAWMEDEQGIVLLTWGSSTCTPVVENIAESATDVTVTFASSQGACTMDMVPRATILGLSQQGEDRALTLVGDNLDARIQVLG